MRGLTVALACVALFLAPGCGGDDEDSGGDSTTPIPTLPDTATEPDTTGNTVTEEQPAPAPAPEPDPGSGGAEAPPPAADSPENDIPPPEDSPAERFEQFCADNPGACEQ